MLKKQWCLIFLLIVCNGIITHASECDNITLTSGLMNYQVFQRNESDHADITFQGRCDIEDQGIVQAQVINNLSFLTIIEWQNVGSYTNNRWHGALKYMPVGGPYRINIRLTDTAGHTHASLSVDNILVGDLWILAGQSNMQGCGRLVDTESPSVWVNSFGFNEKWATASEPLHWLMDSIDPVHHPGIEADALTQAREKQKKDAVIGTGCGISFAKELVNRTGVPVGLVPCAHGGTSMEQWDPAKRDEGGKSLYGSMYRRYLAVGGKVKGVLWYQGESDASINAAPLFHDRFTQFVAAVRRDFNAPNLPFYFVQIGRYVHAGELPQWNKIREAQRLSAQEIPNCRMVSSIDLSLDDPIHIGTQSHKRLGKRLALLALKDLSGNTELESGPVLDCLEPVPGYLIQYRLHVKGVNGKLKAPGRPSGFSVRDNDRNDLFLLYKTLISQNGQSIDLFLSKQPPKDACLWYGYGLDPYCNIIDSKDMALPAFGPVPLGEALYPAFLETIENEPTSSRLILMLPYTIPFIKTSQKETSKFYPAIKDIIKKMPSDNRAILYPLLFDTGDFSHWNDWFKNVQALSLTQRKQVAMSFNSIEDSHYLKADFITNWYLAGVFDNTGCLGFDRVCEPEQDSNVNRSYVNSKGQSISWKQVQTDTNGILNLRNQIGDFEYVIAYAQTIIESKKSCKIPVLFGSDDAPVVWVNGKEIHREHVHRPLQPASDLIFASLKKGENIILVKVCQRTGDWGLCMQLLDKDNVLIYE